MQFVKVFNQVIAILFCLCYSYQFIYMIIAAFCRQKPHGESVPHRFAVLIAARNEESVVGHLIESLKDQNYPQELVDIFVVADNCTDKTAWVARASGATVFERTNTKQVGKGYALKYLIDQVKEHAPQPYDAYLVFDADNVVDPHFITEINKVYSDGYEVVTGYRNSKNYGDSWISAGYGLNYIRECRCLNFPRQILGLSSAITGTGYMFSERVLEECGGWKFFLLTEDWEFTSDNLLRDMKIGYAKDAIIYDEQPTTFRMSWKQRLRWCRGYLQVMRRHGIRLVGKVLRGNFSCYDLMMSILPAAMMTLASLIVNLGSMVANAFNGSSAEELLHSLGILMLQLCLALFVFGLITTLLEWKHIHCPVWKKLLYLFTYPIFMASYIPIQITSIFVKVKWQPIAHTRVMNLEQIKARKVKNKAR